MLLAKQVLVKVWSLPIIIFSAPVTWPRWSDRLSKLWEDFFLKGKLPHD